MPDQVLELIEKHKVTTMFGIPVMFLLMSMSERFDETDFSSIWLMIAGGAPCPVPLIEKYLEKGVEFSQGYGLTIADSDGTVMAQLGNEEGVIVEEVTLDPSRKTGACPACNGRWVRKVPLAIKQWRLLEAMGAAYYRFSGERRRRAMEISRTAAGG